MTDLFRKYKRQKERQNDKNEVKLKEEEEKPVAGKPHGNKECGSMKMKKQKEEEQNECKSN